MTCLCIPLSSLKPMDWLCTDLCEKKFSSGHFFYYLIIKDRASGFVRAYKLAGNKTKHIISSLQDFVEVYYGPPYIITSDAGPQFASANKAIADWCWDMVITHEIRSALSPQSNGESESALKKVKMAISHAKTDSVRALEAAVHTINWEQRLDLSGCSAELFLHRPVRMPGLFQIPNHLFDVELEKGRRCNSRESSVTKSQESRRKTKEEFVCGTKVFI